MVDLKRHPSFHHVYAMHVKKHKTKWIFFTVLALPKGFHSCKWALITLQLEGCNVHYCQICPAGEISKTDPINTGDLGVCLCFFECLVKNAAVK